ncbi:hypothetical protein GDO86_012453 [Hymenochirus boettgeri]|uniref:TIR domain-containing protein n=1 Tax=Hymenochirus boettgeri TaxID=247094 RepID=A0A8T2IQ24_9PIPI|nr:hypothetical protein GDO86_012453 [Hymenochirus boettgeri]
MILMLQNTTVISGYGFEKCSLEGKYTEYANCVGQGAVNIPEVIQDLPARTKWLNVSQNEIVLVENYAFSHLPNLYELRLSKNKINTVQVNAFYNLSNLSLLDLSFNLIQTFDKVDVTNLRSLRILLIGHNKIHTIQKGFPMLLPVLEELDLSYNNISNFRTVANAVKYLQSTIKLNLCSNFIMDLKNDETLVLSSLQYLNLCNNSVSRLDFTFYIMPSLTELDVRRNNMSVVNTSSLFNLPMLSKITFDENSLNISQLLERPLHEITEFHWSSMRPALQHELTSACQLFKTFPKLQMLDIKHSKILNRNISIIGSCTNLTSLILSTSPIYTLNNSEFKNFKHLEVLYLDKCKLKKITKKAWTGLTSLRTLILERNQISNLDDLLFSPLIKLQYLDLSKNYLTFLNKNAFRGLHQLKYLSLKGCKIASLTSKSFAYLNSLRILDMQDNSISLLKGNSFYTLKKLKILLLSGNKILTVQKYGLNGLKSLTQLSLANNNIYKLTNNTLRWVKSLKILDISKNQLGSFNKFQSPHPFFNLKKLEILNASYQMNSNMFVPTTLFEGLKNLKVLKFQGNPGPFFKNMSFHFLCNLKELDISEIVYRMADHPVSFNSESFSRLSQLKVLTLDNNALQSLPDDMFSNLPSLEHISLRNNRLTNIRQNILQNLPNLTYFDVSMNTLSCSCDNYWFQNWSLFNTEVQVPFFQSYKCFGHDVNELFFANQDYSFCIEDGFSYFIESFMLTFTFLIVTLLVVKLKWTLLYLYSMLQVWIQWKVQKERKTYKYDAYISYCSDDENWVVENLLVMLEMDGHHKYKICFKPRDFVPGSYYIDNIQDAISSSRKTLCVVSRKYLESDWCRTEMQLACSRVFYYKQDVLLTVFLEEIPDYR